MTTTAQHRDNRPTTPERWHRPMVWMTVAMALMAVLTLAGVFLDPRMLAGEPIWIKPFNFALSIGTYTVTWAWMLSLLPVARRFANAVGTLVVLLLSVECVGLVVQAARGERSHFNKSSEFDTVLGNVMGLSAAVIMLGTFVFAVVFFFARIRDTAALWAIRLGALLSVGGMVFGPLMGSETPFQEAERLAGRSDGIVGAHTVGAPDGGPGLPITGWSTVAGDLRVPHLVGLHALQVLPLLAMALGVLASRHPILAPVRVRVGLVVTAAVAYGGLLATVGWQAFRGQSVVRPDSATLTALGIVVTVAVIGSAVSVGLGRKSRRIIDTR